MLIKFTQIEERFFKATNVVSEHVVHIYQDLLGDFRGSWEIQQADGTFLADESDGFTSFEAAASWCEAQGIVMTTTFGG